MLWKNEVWVYDNFGETSHNSDVIMSAMAFQSTDVSIGYSNVCSGAYQIKHKSFASLVFVRGIHRSPVNPAQRASNAENVSIWWRHHVYWNRPTIYPRPRETFVKLMKLLFQSNPSSVLAQTKLILFLDRGRFIRQDIISQDVLESRSH